MPIFIPEHFPANANNGEKQVLDILKKLPDDCIVCHEPLIKRMRPDFVIFSPRLGILVVEVKSYFSATIIDGDQNVITIKPNNKLTTTQTHPLKQAIHYMYGIREKLLNSSLHEEIINRQDHHYQGRLLFPLAACVIFTNITKHNINNHLIQQSTARFPSENTIFSNEMRALEAPEIFGEALESRLKRLFVPTWNFNLSERQQAVVYSIFSNIPLDKLFSETLITEKEKEQSSKDLTPPMEKPEQLPTEMPMDTSPIGLAVDSILQQFFSLNTSKKEKETNIGLLKNEMQDIGKTASVSIDVNLIQCAQHISKIATEISQGIGDQTTQRTNELYYVTKALKLRSDEVAIKKDIDDIEQQQQHLKKKISKLATILELETV